MTETTPKEVLRRLKILHTGRHNAVNGKQLAVAMGYMGTDGPRRIREHIHELRRQHFPVCSDHDNGYWFPASREDAEEGSAYIRKLFKPLREANDGYFAGLDELFEPNLFDTVDEREVA